MAPVHLQGESGVQESLELDESLGNDWNGMNCANALATVLSQLTSACSWSPDLTDAPTGFDATEVPKISLKDYAARIAKFSGVTEECFVLSFVYLDRLVVRNPEFVITNLNVHRLLITSIVVAAKFQDDDYYSNEYFARVGGVSTKELMDLETHLLKMLGWNAHVSKEDYKDGMSWFLFWCGLAEPPLEKADYLDSASQKCGTRKSVTGAYLGCWARGVQSWQSKRTLRSQVCGRRRCDTSRTAHARKRSRSSENARHVAIDNASGGLRCLQ